MPISAVINPRLKYFPGKSYFLFPGQGLENCRYEQLIPSVAGSLEQIRNLRLMQILSGSYCGDFVTTEDGTRNRAYSSCFWCG